MEEFADHTVLASIDRVREFLTVCIEAEERLKMLKLKLEAGRKDAVRDYLEFRTKMISSFHNLLALIREFSEERIGEKTPLTGMISDLKNLESYFLGIDGEKAIELLAQGKIGKADNQITIMESMLNYYYWAFNSTVSKLKEYTQRTLVKELLRRGGLIPKFVELRKLLEKAEIE